MEGKQSRRGSPHRFYSVGALLLQEVAVAGEKLRREQQPFRGDIFLAEPGSTWADFDETCFWRDRRLQQGSWCVRYPLLPEQNLGSSGVTFIENRDFAERFGRMIVTLHLVCTLPSGLCVGIDRKRDRWSARDVRLTDTRRAICEHHVSYWLNYYLAPKRHVMRKPAHAADVLCRVLAVETIVARAASAASL